MLSIDRRQMIRLAAAAVGGLVLQPHEVLATDNALRASQLPVAPTDPVRTEHFETGALEIEDVHSLALAAMLLDLHQRREHDRSCHAGEAGPHEPYLTSWIDYVTAELHSRGDAASA